MEEKLKFLSDNIITVLKGIEINLDQYFSVLFASKNFIIPDDYVKTLDLEFIKSLYIYFLENHTEILQNRAKNFLFGDPIYTPEAIQSFFRACLRSYSKVDLESFKEIFALIKEQGEEEEVKEIIELIWEDNAYSSSSELKRFIKNQLAEIILSREIIRSIVNIPNFKEFLEDEKINSSVKNFIDTGYNALIEEFNNLDHYIEDIHSDNIFRNNILDLAEEGLLTDDQVYEGILSKKNLLSKIPVPDLIKYRKYFTNIFDFNEGDNLINVIAYPSDGIELVLEYYDLTPEDVAESINKYRRDRVFISVGYAELIQSIVKKLDIADKIEHEDLIPKVIRNKSARF